MARYAERRRRLYRRPTAQFTKFEGMSPAPVDIRPRPRTTEDLPGEEQELIGWEQGTVTEKEIPTENVPLTEQETQRTVYAAEILSQAREEEREKVREKLETMSDEELQAFHAQRVMAREVAELTGDKSEGILAEIQAAERISFERGSKTELEQMMEEYPYFSREMLDFMNKHGDGRTKQLVENYKMTFLELLANKRELRIMLQDPQMWPPENIVATKHRLDELERKFDKLTDDVEAAQFNLIIPKDSEGKFKKLLGKKSPEDKDKA